MDHRTRRHTGRRRFAMRSPCRTAARVFTAAVLLVAASPAGSDAAQRVALVIGNGTYEATGNLSNAPNDARDVGAALHRLGFEVTTVSDADLAQMNQSLRDLARRSSGADIALVYYAGHGMEMDGVNYLVPVDARLTRDTDVPLETVQLDRILQATVGAALRMVILDACRDNPLTRSILRTTPTRTISRGGFDAVDEDALGDEVLVAYSAAAGTTAEDGAGRNSPYTRALLEHLEGPHEVLDLFRRVRRRVLEETDRRQRPHEYQALLNEHYLASARNPAAQDLYREGADVAAGGVPGSGLKYQIFRQGLTGEAVPVDPQSAVFRAGDRIRFVFETNGGYLHIMLDGSSGRSFPLFPDPAINGGRNEVAPFVPVAIPPDGWFEFDDTPGVERVHVYVTQARERAPSGPGRSLAGRRSAVQPTVDEMRSTVQTRDLFYTKTEDATQSLIVVNEAAGNVYWTIDLHHR